MSDGAASPLGVLVMAHGGPESIEDVGTHYTSIRRGRPPGPEQLARLVARYERVGGVTPLRAVTFAQAEALGGALAAHGVPARVQVGMKYGRPSIEEAVRGLAAGGVRGIAGIVLAPHYSRLSVAQYIERAEGERARAAPAVPAVYVEGWGANPALLEALASRVRACLDGWRPERTLVLFTAHSLPERIREWDDPYERQVSATASAVASALEIPLWRVAWQSAPAGPEPWIGPDMRASMRSAAGEGLCDQALICPVGYTADNLEVLYDLDVEAAGAASDLGLDFRRTPSLNTDPALIEALRTEIAAACQRLVASG